VNALQLAGTTGSGIDRRLCHWGRVPQAKLAGAVCGDAETAVAAVGNGADFVAMGAFMPRRDLSDLCRAILRARLCAGDCIGNRVGTGRYGYQSIESRHSGRIASRVLFGVKVDATVFGIKSHQLRRIRVSQRFEARYRLLKMKKRRL